MACSSHNGTAVLVALLVLCVIGVRAVTAPNITLVPGKPSENIYLSKPTNPLQPFGVYFEVNASSFPNANAMVFLLTRDTTRSPVQVYWSTNKPFPNPFEHEGNLHFNDQNNGHHFIPPPRSPTMQGMYYFGVYLTSSSAAAYFNVMTTFYNSTQFAPPDNANISLSTRILTSSDKDQVPSISASWFTLLHHNYTFYRFPHACGMNILVNDVDYVLANAQAFHDVAPEEEGEILSTTLTDFDDTIDTFCINVVATREGFRPTSYLAQTLYYPHVRDGIQPQKVDWKHWKPGTWAEIVLTGMLFVGAPIGIIIHRIWISRRRAQKRRAALMAGPTWIN